MISALCTANNRIIPLDQQIHITGRQASLPYKLHSWSGKIGGMMDTFISDWQMTNQEYKSALNTDSKVLPWKKWYGCVEKFSTVPSLGHNCVFSPCYLLSAFLAPWLQRGADRYMSKPYVERPKSHMICKFVFEFVLAVFVFVVFVFVA